MKLTFFELTGTPSVRALTKVFTTPDQRCVILVALSGQEPSPVMDQISEKVSTAHVQDGETFFSLLNRIVDLSAGLEIELAAVYLDTDQIWLSVINGDIWLNRDGKIGRVLTSPQTLKIVQGSVKADEEYLLLTQSSSVALHHQLHDLQTSSSIAAASGNWRQILNDSGLADRSGIVIATIEDSPIPLANTTSELAGNQLHSAAAKAQSGPSPLIKNLKILIGKMAQLGNQLIQSQPHKFPERVKYRLASDRGLKQKLLAGLSLIVVLIVLWFGFQFYKSRQISQANAFVQPFSAELVEIQNLATTDSIAARDRAVDLKNRFESELAQNSRSSFFRNQTTGFEQNLTKYIELISGKVELETLPTFYDFRLVQSDFLASDGDVDGEQGIFLDKERQTAVLISLTSKQINVLPIGQFPVLKSVTMVNQNIYYLADGIYQQSQSSEQEPTKIINEGDSNREAIMLDSFGDFLYVFNPIERNIFRYSLTQDAIEPIGWLVDKQGLDFELVNSMSVDGNIWLGMDNGEIWKYDRGNRIAFDIRGLQEPFANPIKIFTAEEADVLVVLESDANRVVILDKEGTFLREVKSPLLGAATNIVMSSTTNTAYALAGSVLYEIGL